MKLETDPYLAQCARWPNKGRHILAHHDAATIVVYQAYKPSIAAYAVTNGRLGGPEFSFARMSWIKPNFMWMMYRSGWGAKAGQEATLGLRIARHFFDALLEQAIASSFDPERFADHAAWTVALEQSEVRLQWDPDHAPTGEKLSRRALQLGLRGEALKQLADDALLEVIDMSPFVAEMALLAATPAALRTPCEAPYMPASMAARANIGLEA